MLEVPKACVEAEALGEGCEREQHRWRPGRMAKVSLSTAELFFFSLSFFYLKRPLLLNKKKKDLIATDIITTTMHYQIIRRLEKRGNEICKLKSA